MSRYDVVETKVGEINVRGAKVPVYVRLDQEDGGAYFYATVDGHKYTSENGAELRQQIMRDTKKTASRIDLQCTRFAEAPDGMLKVEHVTVVGIHGGTGYPLVQVDGTSRAEQDSGRSGGFMSGRWQYTARLTDAELALLRSVKKEMFEAQERWKQVVEEFRIDVVFQAKKLVEEQMVGGGE